jgi:hypothetical protein
MRQEEGIFPTAHRMKHEGVCWECEGYRVITLPEIFCDYLQKYIKPNIRLLSYKHLRFNVGNMILCLNWTRGAELTLQFKYYYK